MKTNPRDRLISLSAVLMVLLLAGGVVAAVLSAERNGQRALEELQGAQVSQLARSFDSRLTTSLAAFNGVATPAWNLAPHDPTDAQRLKAYINPQARAGFYLVNREGIVTNGVLIPPSIIGSPSPRPGLRDAIARAQVTLLPVSAGLTTPLPTFALVAPLPNSVAGGTGALVYEVDVAPDSDFNKEISQLRRSRTDEWDFLDNTGMVVASTNPASLGKPVNPTLVDRQAGFHQRNGKVLDSVPVPSAGWRVVFSQDRSEFEGRLTGPLRSALLLLIVVALLGAGVTFFALVARLRAAREEQRRLAAIAEAREEFISIVSHELRTPATGQLGFLQTLLDHWTRLSDEERRRTVTQAYANARRLHALTRDVLDTASIEAGELPYAFEEFDLVPSIHNAVSALSGATDHPVAVTGEKGPVVVRGDPERIQQVLTNLLDNAVKNSPAGSGIEIVLATEDGKAKVEVSDRGMGMTADELSRAFDKFSRGRNTTVQGTGLGLYICRKIMEAHGGQIWATGRTGGGATVAFTLRLAAEPAEDSDAARGRAESSISAQPGHPAAN